MRAIGLAVLLAISPLLIAAKEETAPSETYGDWTVRYLTEVSTIASTSNNAESVFGVICDKDGCEAIFNPGIACNDGGKYAALVNSPAAAFSVELSCTKLDDLFIYSLPLEGGISEAMSVGGVLGVAFPMESGQFNVSRFSLTGAARASARAHQVAQSLGAPSKQNASDDFSL